LQEDRLFSSVRGLGQPSWPSPVSSSKSLTVLLQGPRRGYGYLMLFRVGYLMLFRVGCLLLYWVGTSCYTGWVPLYMAGITVLWTSSAFEIPEIRKVS